MAEMLPSSGEEYIRMVRAQAKSCPVVVVASSAKVKEHLAVKNTSHRYRITWNSCVPAPEGCAPTEEWKAVFLKDFEIARRSLRQFQECHRLVEEEEATIKTVEMTRQSSKTPKTLQKRMNVRPFGAIETDLSLLGGQDLGGDEKVDSEPLEFDRDEDQKERQEEEEEDGGDDDGEQGVTRTTETRTCPVPQGRETESIPLPRMNDQTGWRTLLYGQPTTSDLSTSATKTKEPAKASKAAAVLAVIGTANSQESSDSMQPAISSAAVMADEAGTGQGQEQGREQGKGKGQTPGQEENTPGVTNDAPSTIPSRLSEKKGMRPEPRFLIRLNQGHLFRLLQYHMRWMAEDDMTEQEGKWLYAIFLKLDRLVESDEVSILRNMAKKCARIRSHLHIESGSKLATVNMVITIVARFFGQEDLE
ncbi:gem (nuclear organelle) associated protein 2 [Lunasporangiospora selenospora]|uniref:Gem (Nuclear organelle) associated protein 2 n=1 Tax=Lunasporangiospora selenospora TaxID=979761 RepID=A0A9P6FW93_9FUNG|nr:gem (nuclear organelle) associated protein 2 [Lunasporangiospora selenospora]